MRRKAYKDADLLKHSGVEIYCIGITGKRNDDALSRLASKEENVFIVRNYDALQWIAEILTNGTIGLLKTSHETAMKLFVERIVIHDDFNAATFQNNIALLRLRDEIVYEKSVRPICLPQLNKPQNLHYSQTPRYPYF
ncbi:hypothetical protein V5799_014703 [Amblyomma americanum]|uniref:Uncharacterized protein n=1 Tax=Amblyomma americanum TaxID=6943 RepID=A0AAQ4E292_AMBAM